MVDDRWPLIGDSQNCLILVFDTLNSANGRPVLVELIDVCLATLLKKVRRLGVTLESLPLIILNEYAHLVDSSVVLDALVGAWRLAVRVLVRLVSMVTTACCQICMRVKTMALSV